MEVLVSRFNEETDPTWNREAGIVIIPGSNLQKENEKWEQFPGKWGSNPGNPYRYQPFPKMLYRADKFQGVVVCMAAPPDPMEYANPGEYTRKEEQARRFNESCQKIVKSEAEMAVAMESGWRETPEDAVAWVKARDAAHMERAANRAYTDRNLSEKAQAEVAKAIEAADGDPLAEVPEQPKRRRGRPRKNPEAA